MFMKHIAYIPGVDHHEDFALAEKYLRERLAAQ